MKQQDIPPQIHQPVSDEFSVIAFYGIDHSAVNVKETLAQYLALFETFGIAPDKFSLRWGSEQGKLLSFSYNYKRLSRLGYEGVTDYELYATVPGANLWWNECYLSASYEGVGPKTHTCMTIRQSIASLDDLLNNGLVAKIAAIVQPAYGIGFVKPEWVGPSLYVIGITMGPPGYVPQGAEYEECLRICRWGDIALWQELYRQGIIRDIYPHNYLTQPQLAMPVDGIPLNHWIERDPSRGTLVLLTDQVWLWHLAQEQIANLRPALQQAGIIFDWRRYV